MLETKWVRGRKLVLAVGVEVDISGSPSAEFVGGEVKFSDSWWVARGVFGRSITGAVDGAAAIPRSRLKWTFAASEADRHFKTWSMQRAGGATEAHPQNIHSFFPSPREVKYWVTPLAFRPRLSFIGPILQSESKYFKPPEHYWQVKSHTACIGARHGKLIAALLIIRRECISFLKNYLFEPRLMRY